MEVSAVSYIMFNIKDKKLSRFRFFILNSRQCEGKFFCESVRYTILPLLYKRNKECVKTYALFIYQPVNFLSTSLNHATAKMLRLKYIVHITK